MKTELPKDWTDIHGWFDEVQLYNSAAKRAKEKIGNYVIVEVGSYMGRSTALMCDCLRQHGAADVAFYAVDTWKGSPEHAKEVAAVGGDLFPVFMANMVALKNDRLVFPIQRASRDAAALFLTRSVDFCYIDANHSADNVMRDLEAWYPKVVCGGILAGHDFYWGEVRLAVEMFCRMHQLKYKVVDSSWVIEI